MSKYLKISAAKAGQEVELDSGFTCREAGKTVLQVDVDGALWFHCNHGKHYLPNSEETGDDGSLVYTGIYPVED